MFNTLALPALLLGCKTWAIGEKCKSSITSVELKFMRCTAQHNWQDYKTSEDILSEIKINLVAKKIQNYGNKWIQRVRRMGRDGLMLLIIKRSHRRHS
jgi:hypothetical protein